MAPSIYSTTVDILSSNPVINIACQWAEISSQQHVVHIKKYAKKGLSDAKKPILVHKYLLFALKNEYLHFDFIANELLAHHCL